MDTMGKFMLLVVTAIAAVFSAKATCSLKVHEYGVSSAEQDTIVNKHNEVRLLLAQGKVSGQPRAVNLKRIKYDAKLAQEAQNIANTCVFAHVPVSDSRWSHVGQNLFITKSTDYGPRADWNSVVQAWFDEHKVYTYPNNPNFNTGHYTQVTWATTEYVGCGYTYYPTNEQFKYHKLYVCNYGPGGNIVGQAPYRTGSTSCENLC